MITEYFSDYRRSIGWSVILSGLIVVVIDFIQGDYLVASIVLAAVVIAAGLLVWWTRPSAGGFHVSHAEARQAAGSDGLIVYWRPG